MATTPQPTIRTPILDYALTHPVAVYTPPAPIVPAANTIVIGLTAGGGTLTSDTTIPSDTTGTVTVGATIYVFKTTLTVTPGVEGEVLIGGSATAAFNNLVKAINRTGVNGTDYWIAALNPNILAAGPYPTMTITARFNGTEYAASIATSASATSHMAWSFLRLTGGTDSVLCTEETVTVDIITDQ